MTGIRSAALACFPLAVACSNGNGGATGTTSGSGGTTSGTSGNQSDSGFALVPLDLQADNQTAFCMAVGPAGQIGVAYFRGDAGTFLGSDNLAPMYTEVDGMTGAVTVAPALVRPVVQLEFGCAVAFQPGGLPAVGLLGGGDYNGTTADSGAVLPDGGGGGSVTGSLYWFQSQAELDYRLADGGWLRDICMDSSTGGECQVADPPNESCPKSNDGASNGFKWPIFYNGGEDKSAEQLCNNPFGEVVGLWPALLFDGGTAVMAFRDVHEGQFSGSQDWGASDVKMCIGGPNTDFSYTAPLTISASGNNQENGYGVHTELVFGPAGALALAGDIDVSGAGEEVSGSGPISFAMQTGMNGHTSADWTPPQNLFSSVSGNSMIGDPGSGPSLIYDSVQGFGVAAVDTAATPPALYYSTSPDGAPTSWSTPFPIVSFGSEGFFPDLMINPNTGNPIVSYLVCSDENGFTPEGGCDPNSAGIATVERTQAGWGDPTPVLAGTLWHPRMGYLPNGKQVFVYSDMIHGGLYLAIQN